MSDHLDALRLRLSHERSRLEASTTDHERRVRQGWVDGIQREIDHEEEFLAGKYGDDLTTDELYAELAGK